MAVLITPTLPKNFHKFVPGLEAALQDIERAAHQILSSSRHRWPAELDWTTARRVAKQSLNRIVALRVACESGYDTGQIAFEAFELGRHYALWKRHVVR